MSLFPYLMKFFDNSWDEEFNYNWYPERITRPRFRRQHSLNSYIRPSMFKADFDLKPYLNKCRHVISNLTSNYSNYYDRDGFQVRLNVKNFAPSEIKVQIVGNTIVVEGKHEDKQGESSQFYSQFIRKYSLPSGVNANDVVSSLSSDGLLTIRAKSTANSIETKERVIPIRQTNEAIKSIQKDRFYESKERFIPIRRIGGAGETIRSRTKANEMEFFERIIPIERNNQDTIKSTHHDKIFESRERVVPIRQIGVSQNKAQNKENVTENKREVVVPIQHQTNASHASNDSYKTSSKSSDVTESKAYNREVFVPIQKHQTNATNDSYKTSSNSSNVTESKEYKREVVIPVQHQTNTTNDSYKTSSNASNSMESKERVVKITQIGDAIRENSARAKAAETMRRVSVSMHENIGTIVEEPPTPRLQSQEREIPVINQITEISEGPPKPPRTFAYHERVIPIQQTG